ncbi:MAG: hypothetical protein RR812_02900 [Vagococcus sp.]
MALKGGKIYQELIEIPDKKEEGGCLGCLIWIVVIVAIGWIAFKFR